MWLRQNVLERVPQIIKIGLHLAFCMLNFQCNVTVTTTTTLPNKGYILIHQVNQ